MSAPRSSRRDALRTLSVGVGSLLLPALLPSSLSAQSNGGKPAHPIPRKGITAAKVATPEMLSRSSHLIPLFSSVRAIPHIVDGIRCHCGCADLDGHYSLLTCYEGEDAMAKTCPICQGMGRVAARMAKTGRSLDEIRDAVDAQFGWPVSS